MFMRALLAGTVSLAVMVAWVVADDHKQNCEQECTQQCQEVCLEGVKCVMNPDGPAKAETGVAYKEGKVFFCCKGCAGKFDAEKNAVAANRQLVATKQYKQVACPFSGGACKSEHQVKADGVAVSFCCPNCKGKVEKADVAAQSDLLFSDKAFAKAFKPAKADDEKKQSIQ